MTGICAILECDFKGSQRWKLDDTPDTGTLHNKEDFIKNAEWCFKPGKDDLIYIEKLPEKKVIGISDNNWCTLENFVEDKEDQLWKKGEPDDEGYFTLENSTVPKLITVTSSGFTEGTESFGFKLEDDFSKAEKSPYQTFYLPKDEQLSSMWMKNLKFNKIQFKVIGKKARHPPKGCKTTESLAVCIRHFLKEDLETKIENSDDEGKLRKSLKEDAVPVLFMGLLKEPEKLPKDDLNPKNVPQQSTFCEDFIGLLFQVFVFLLIAAMTDYYGLIKSFF